MMKRRSFIKFSALASGSLLLASRASAALTSNLPHIEFPAENQHVRHGLFSLSEVKNPFIPSWLTMYDRHSFMANGYAPGTDDFQTFNFDLREQSISLGYTKSSVFVAYNKEFHQFNRSSKMHHLIAIDEASKLTVLSGLNYDQLPISQRSFIMVLEGRADLDNDQFESGEFLSINKKDVSPLLYSSQNEETLVLLIES